MKELPKQWQNSGDEYDPDFEDYWGETHSWGSGSMFVINSKPPVKAGGRRPIGFTANIDEFVETWGSPRDTKKVEKNDNLEIPGEPTVPKPV